MFIACWAIVDTQLYFSLCKALLFTLMSILLVYVGVANNIGVCFTCVYIVSHIYIILQFPNMLVARPDVAGIGFEQFVKVTSGGGAPTRPGRV